MKNSFLVVDDDADDRELFSEALASVDSQISCEFAENAEDALNRLGGNGGLKPDLIFLDINLPGMSGWQCLTQLKKTQEHRDIPVIMYSTSSHDRDREIASDLGAISFITKPSEYKLLIEVLSAVVSHCRNGELDRLNGHLKS